MHTISRPVGRFFAVLLMWLACVSPRAVAAGGAGFGPTEAPSAGGKQWPVVSGQLPGRKWAVSSGQWVVSSALAARGSQLAGLYALRSALPAPHAFFGDIQLTQITDTVYYGNGSKAQGKLLISWPAFTTATQNTIAAGSTSVTLGPDGLFNASLAPTVGSTPPGVYYSVVYQLGDGSNKQEYWAVPATQQTTISAVRAKLMPSNVAAQFLTRDLADSVYVHATDNQTIGGVKTFSSNPVVPDPKNPTEVANKEYVDANAGAANLDSPPPIGRVKPNSVAATALTAGTSVMVADGASPVSVTRFGGATADVQMNSAIGYACAHGAHAVSAFGLINVTINANVGLGCPDGTPVEIQIDGSTPFVPGSTGVNMFTLLPGAVVRGTLAVAPITGYSGNVLQLAGHVYDNQPGNFSASKGRTSIDDLTVYGGSNSTGTALYLQGNNPTTEYIEFVEFGRITVTGMRYGVRAVTSQNGWINSNFFARIRCSNTVYCHVADTTDANGNFVGNTIGVYENEYSTSFAPQGIYGLWYKGQGNIENNKILAGRIWDWPDAGAPNYGHNCRPGVDCYTVYVDDGLAHAYGNQLDGMVDLNAVHDANGALVVTDTLTGFSTGNVHNTNGLLEFPRFNATNASLGYLLNRQYVLTGDGNNTILDGMTSAGGAYLRTNNGTQKAYLGANGTFAVTGTQTTQSLVNPFSNTLTSGNFFDAYHDTSVLTGTVFYADVAHGSGRFTGYFANFYNNLSSKFSVDANGNTAVAGDLTARDIPGHAYFVSKYPSIQAAINAAYGSGTVSGAVIDDRTAAYSGPGFYIPDSVTVRLAPVPYSFTSAVTHNNGHNNVTAAIIVEQGAHIVGGGTSSNHGTTITVDSGFANDIIATTSVGTGTGAGVQWWHWGSMENLNIDGTNQTAGECVHVENMGETSKVRDLLVKNCYGNNVEFAGAAATQSDIANISTSRSRNGSGVRFTNLSGLGKIIGLSGDCNAGSLVSAQENAAGTLVIAGLKSEAESTICSNGASHDPVILLDTMAGLNTHVHIAGGYAFGTAQNAVAKVVGSGGGIFETEGFYVTGYTNLLNDTIRSVVVPATTSNSKQPFYYEPNGIVFANQAFTLTPGTGVMGGSTSLTPIFYATTGNATMVAPIGNGDGQSIMTGGVELAGQNRTQYGATPEVMARAGYRFTGSGYDTTKWDFVPAWNANDTTEKNIGNSLTVCQKNGSVSCRWNHIYGVNVDAQVFTLGTYTVATLPSSYAVGSLAWVSDAVTPGDCNVGGGSNRVLCYYTGAAWAALTTGGGAGAWGSITGTLSNQTDLQNALNGKAASNASTTVNGVTCALGSSCTPGNHLVSGTMVGPQSGVVGNGSDQNVFSVTIPAGTVSAGTGFKCAARWAKTSASNAVTYKWVLGSTTLATQAVGASISTNWLTEIEVFTPSSLSAEVANTNAVIAGTTIQSGPQVGLTASENLGNSSTLKLTFNASSAETITPKTFYCTTVQ